CPGTDVPHGAVRPGAGHSGRRRSTAELPPCPGRVVGGLRRARPGRAGAADPRVPAWGGAAAQPGRTSDRHLGQALGTRRRAMVDRGLPAAPVATGAAGGGGPDLVRPAVLAGSGYLAGGPGRSVGPPGRRHHAAVPGRLPAGGQSGRVAAGRGRPVHPLPGTGVRRTVGARGGAGGGGGHSGAVDRHEEAGTGARIHVTLRAGGGGGGQPVKVCVPAGTVTAPRNLPFGPLDRFEGG